MSGRWAAVTKSPLTGTVTDSHQGGWSGARLRWAGLDGLIFAGRAERPVYAFVSEGEVELRDASEVWGKGIHETVAFFQERYGEKDLSVCAIGQAGERMSRFAAWLNEDDRAFGRGGTGAVGGSKQLKAIVIQAKKKKSQVMNTKMEIYILSGCYQEMPSLLPTPLKMHSPHYHLATQRIGKQHLVNL